MKKRKLLCLLAAALAFTVPFSACKDKEDDGAVQVTEHELWQNFVMEEEKKNYSNVYRIDGALEAYDQDHNLAVIKTEDLDNDNVVTTKYTVYDLSKDDAGKEIFSKTIRNLYDAEYPSSVNITLNYPLIEMSERYYVDNTETEDPDDRESKSKYSYYLIKENNAQLLVGDLKRSSLSLLRMVENLYVCEIDEKVYWINQDMEVLRTLNKIPEDSYHVNLSFDAEYNDYLYAWNTSTENPLTRSIQVFNKEGVCSMQYSFPNDAALAEVYVLNNGNIFVQEQVVLEAAEKEYDYKLFGQKIDLVSKIINYKTGEVKELDLNFIVSELESAYAGQEYSAFPLQLKEGKQNQAYIKYFNESGMANRMKYVVLDNEMNIGYTFKNDTLDLMSEHEEIEVVNKDYYLAYTTVNGISGEYLFNLDGNVVTKLPENLEAITKDFIVTPQAIYDLNMNLVFDVETSTFGSNRGKSYECSVLGDKIFLMATNYLTGAEVEVYLFDTETKQPTLFCDGIKTEADVEDGAYYVEDFEDGTIALYDMSDNLLVKVQDYDDITLFEDVMVMELEIDDKDVCYVLKRA